MVLLFVMLAVFAGVIVLDAVSVFGWTPLIAGTDFAGVNTDVMTVVTNLITIFIIIAAFGILIHVFTR